MHIRTKAATDILINLPPGKLSKTGERKSIKRQKSISCVLYALRRISFFSSTPQRETLYTTFRAIKHELSHFRGDYSVLVKLGLQACDFLHFDFKKECRFSRLFWKFYNQAQQFSGFIMKSTPEEFAMILPDKEKWNILYGILLNKAFLPLFSAQTSHWEPQQGFIGLMNSLTQQGAHVFLGKFGFWCHNQTPIEHPIESQQIPGRKVYYFPKNSFAGDRTIWLHAVVVDQAKILDGRPMIFFRDPYNNSDPGQEEKVYMLSYDAFLQRLVDFGSFYNPTQSPHYGLVSQDPAHLTLR